MLEKNIEQFSEKIKEEEPEIVKFYLDQEGKSIKPKEWIYPKDKNKKPIFKNPVGIDSKDVFYFLDSDGNWKGGNPDEKLLEEIKKWRYDWME